MKKSIFVLATLALFPSLYGQENFDREKVLEIFSQYNPVVLEKAQENKDYHFVLETLAEQYNFPITRQSRLELIAIARNFDNSIRLDFLTDNYKKSVFLSQVGGMDLASVRAGFSKELMPIFQNVWAVTVQVKELELKEYREELSSVKKDKSLSKEQKQNEISFLKQAVKNTKQEIKLLKKEVALQLLDAVEEYIAQTDWQIAQEQAASAEQATAKASAVKETENLQVKTKNKKPVAK